MIFITGDVHGNARDELYRFTLDSFIIQKELTKKDYVIILGDFGFIWSNTATNAEISFLDWIEDRPWTTLFIDGNHENHDRLDSYPVEMWNGGKVHFIRPSIIHLMRGQIFNICGKTFATMGGAPSHDTQDGIFDPVDYDTKKEMWEAIRNLEKEKGGYQYALYRIKGESWWEREIPSEKEWAELYKNLSKYNYKVDFILTHEAPASVVPFVGIYPPTKMSQQLEEVRIKTTYGRWYFGHYHLDKVINNTDMCIYNKLFPIA